MLRPLLWLLGGVASFLGAVALTAPGLLAGRALLLGLAPVLPAAVVALVLWDVRRRSDVYGGHTAADPDDPEGP